ncbi:thymidylate synthase [Luteolibacter flavescens]|uniref:thymidylate synthase n=1 Tax=Luteolibacter flavescens TaxID=1859460 RepID=A0ABT3FVT1_9BACT|nr:thymidylate synthase [Luteolibacter flavescens]MCW1887512.1 thymidylate synthase [Luteolibacter flavescens]
MKSPSHSGASRGDNREIRGALLKLTNPRARLSRSETRGKIFSGLGELVWYLSGSNRLDDITPYVEEYKNNSDDGLTIFGAYGPRLLTKKAAGRRRPINQLTNIIELLDKYPGSRRAVIQLFDAADLLPPRKKEIPCTCTLQFMVRGNKLDMHAHMRSNDAFWGLPHDIFCFTMLQEIVARSLGKDLGNYIHSVGSLHIYEKFEARAKAYLQEGWQSTRAMPDMPKENPWDSISKLLQIESQARGIASDDHDHKSLPDYWADLARLIQIFHVKDDSAKVALIKARMSNRFYSAYISRRTPANMKKIVSDV